MNAHVASVPSPYHCFVAAVLGASAFGNSRWAEDIACCISTHAAAAARLAAGKGAAAAAAAAPSLCTQQAGRCIDQAIAKCLQQLLKALTTMRTACRLPSWHAVMQCALTRLPASFSNTRTMRTSAAYGRYVILLYVVLFISGPVAAAFSIAFRQCAVCLTSGSDCGLLTSAHLSPCR